MAIAGTTAWCSVVKTYVAHMLKHSICCTFTASCVVVVVVRPWHPCVVVVVVVVRPKNPCVVVVVVAVRPKHPCVVVVVVVVRPKTHMCGCGCGCGHPSTLAQNHPNQ